MAQSIYEAPATRCAVITPDDDADLDDVPRALICGSSGDLEIIAADDSEAVLIEGLTSGTLLPLRVTRVLEATTIDPLIALY